MPFGIYSTVRPSPHGNNGELRKKCVAIEKDWKAATPKRRQWKTHEWGENVKRKLILEVAQRGYGTRTRNIRFAGRSAGQPYGQKPGEDSCPSLWRRRRPCFFRCFMDKFEFFL